jgi:porphobilinogen deaminase
MGVYTRVEDGLHLKAAVFSRDGKEKYEAEARGEPEKAEEVGRRCAERLLKKGAGEILDDKVFIGGNFR